MTDDALLVRLAAARLRSGDVLGALHLIEGGGVNTAVPAVKDPPHGGDDSAAGDPAPPPRT